MTEVTGHIKDLTQEQLDGRDGRDGRTGCGERRWVFHALSQGTTVP